MRIFSKITLPLILTLTAIITAGPCFSQMEFIQNKGQWDEKVNYRGDFVTGAFFLEGNGFTVLMHDAKGLDAVAELYHGYRHSDSSNSKAVPIKDDGPVTLRSHAYNMRFAGGNANAVIEPEKVSNTYNNYFIGNDHSKWAANCKIYNAISYKNIYPGIDVRYYSASGRLKYDFIVHPGADLSKIAMKYTGVNKLTVVNKELIIGTSVGDVKELYPYAYEASPDGKSRKTVDCKYQVINDVVSFKVTGRNNNATMVIDPTVIFSSFTGSTADNWGFTATPGPDGSFYAGGIVFGSGYPVTTGAIQTTFAGGASEDNSGPYDIGLMKLSPNGTQKIFATYLGGSGNEQPHSMICDPAGNLVISGRSSSPNYPISIPQVGAGGGYDIIVTKLRADGKALLGSIRIGGSADDGVNIRPKYSAPTAYTPSLGDYIRRNYGDDARSEVILDGANNIYLASCTQSANFPVTAGVMQSTFRGGKQDGAVMKFTPGLTAVSFSSFFGGTGNDACFVMSLNPLTGNLYVGGVTTSNDLQGNFGGSLFNSYQGGNCDGFVLEMDVNGSANLKTTYVGTSGDDMLYGLKFDKKGFPYVMGTTTGNWPVISAAYSNAGSKQYIAKLQPDLSAWVYSTVFGSVNSTLPNLSPIAFLVDRCENVYVSGWGGGIDAQFGFPVTSTTFGLPIKDQLPNMPGPPDGKDFYFFVLEKNAVSQFFGSYFGQSGGIGDHVDGGTSRFDANGVIYQAMCANCQDRNTITFPTTPGVVAPVNGSSNCNEAMVKIEMNFAGVGAAPRAAINGVANDTSGCTTLHVDFNDTLGKGKMFIWDFGDNTRDTVYGNSSTSHDYAAIGRYRVMLIAIDSATCNISDTAFITIRAGNNKATPDFIAEKVPPCTNLAYKFTNTSFATFTGFNANSFIWDYGDGSPREVAGANPPRVHLFPSPGTYKVKLIVDDTTFCNSPDSVIKTIRINPQVKAMFTTPATGCVQYNAVFTNTSLAGTDFLWDFGDNTFSTLDNPTHLYPNAGTYKVRLIAYDTSTCNKVDTSAYFTITVFDNPIANFTFAPNPPEENTAARFTNLTIGANRYVWDFGDGETSTEVNPVHLFNATGTYHTVLYAYNVANCLDTFALDVPARIKSLLDVPNAFTPGRNGINAVVKVAGFGIGKMNWKIYNRWGQVVFSTEDRRQGWDGTFKGALQPMDVYTYALDVEFTDGMKERKTGDITLLR